MAKLYGGAYSKRLSGFAGKIGGTLELFFLQRMGKSAYIKDAQAIIDDITPEKKPNALFRVTYEGGKVVEQAVYSPRVLEIGCNDGHFAMKEAHPKNFGWGIYAVDTNESAIASMVEKHKRNPQPDYKETTGLTVAVMDMQALQFKDASFRKVWARHVLEHVPDPAKGIEEIVRVTEPGGIIGLTFPYEPVRGLAAVPSAIAATGNPFDARKLHLHKLTPGRVARLFDPQYIFGDKRMLLFTPYPVWIQVFLRNNLPYDRQNYTPFVKRTASSDAKINKV